MIYDVIIVGGGTAGMTAALYVRRSNKSVLILEKENFGGQIANSPRVENYPTLQSISGSEFSDKLFEQITSWGSEFELEDVLSIEKKEQIFFVKTNYHLYQARSVILANGVHHKKINLPFEDQLVGNGLSYCAVCDGAFYQNEEVAVIGDGNSALQYALLLSNYCKKVFLCILFERFFADEALIHQIKNRENITIVETVSLKQFQMDENKKLKGLLFENTKKKEDFYLPVKAVFVAIGQIPDNQRFSNLVKLDAQGYICTDDSLKTATNGIYAAGDCRVKKVRQLTTAVSDGSIAAINIVNYLDTLLVSS